MNVAFATKSDKPCDVDCFVIRKINGEYRLFVDGDPILCEDANSHLEVYFNAPLESIKEACDLPHNTVIWRWEWSLSFEDEFKTCEDEWRKTYERIIAKEKRKWTNLIHANIFSLTATCLLMIAYIIKLLR